jgi:hypothetical protein
MIFARYYYFLCIIDDDFFDSATTRREEVVRKLKTEPPEAGSNRYLVVFTRASQSDFSDFT